ncbi:hypothetical protein [Rhizobium sp. Leaf383]|uniref:hypothetical protein n=1 Tax=Rhizobium sp. Leaf383 TaxID=1736357 RepID=UPI0012E3CC92|nr:hypothetical protein [Rhizobium sp. Leaf383]
MGDFERTFGAGADASDIVGSHAGRHVVREFEHQPQNSIFPTGPNLPNRPEGMTGIEWALLSELQRAAVRARRENFGEDVCPLSHWQLLKIVSRLPSRNDLDRIQLVRENGCVEAFDKLITQARRSLIERGKRLTEEQPWWHQPED